MKVHVLTAAREDILRQYRYYLIEKDASTTAERFLDAVEAATGALRRNPGIGAPKHLKNPELAGLRSWPVEGFSAIRIYYIHSQEALKIVRVLHGKRDVGFLLEDSRLED